MIKPQVKFLDAIVKWHENRWWAFSPTDNSPLYPIFKKCTEIFPTCIVYYRKKQTDLYKEYKVIEIFNLNGEQQVTLENKESRLTDKLSNCTRVIESQRIRGFMVRDEDDTKTEDELCEMDFHPMSKYFYVQEENKEDNSILAKVIMEAVQESMTNSKNIIECLSEKGYKLVKQ